VREALPSHNALVARIEPVGARIDAVALTFGEKIGPRAYKQLTTVYGSPSQALLATYSTREQARLRSEAEAALDNGRKVGAKFLLIGDADYPTKLYELHDPPPYLFVLGDLSVLERPCVAVVGTRRATAYGEWATKNIVEPVAAAGGCVESGLARGIDAVGHRAALSCGGATVAVLGTGVDVAYPVGHRALHRTIAERGLVISEFPCGASANKGSFPRRNRIIAAVASLTIVIEAPDRSGAMITEGHATDLGRDVGAVPGPINSPQSAESNRLIQFGAHTILHARDVLSLLGVSAPSTRAAQLELTLAPDELTVWGALEHAITPTDVLAERVELPTNRVLAAVTGLEVRGLIETLPTGELRRCRLSS
jgi:DNA processing protein